MSFSNLKLRPYTTKEQILSKYERVVAGFGSGKTRSLEFRKEQLRSLYFALKDNEEVLKRAVSEDLHRNPVETEILEYHECLAEANIAIANLDSWAADESTGAGDLRMLPARPKLRKSPYGAVLVFSPWNYPVLCSVVPVIAAIAAGNTVVLKPTEMAPVTTEVLAGVLENALDPDIFQVVLGSVAESTALLELKWGKIMVTGSCGVGRIVATAAAKNLTPVTLELGGKSPVFVTSDANIPLAAKRVAWGKFVNAGQTCVAPDYVLVDAAVRDEFVTEVEKAVKRFYPNLTPTSSGFAHIVTDRLWERQNTLVDSTKGKVVFQWGKPDEAAKFYPPTLVTDVTINDPLMQEEIFGPILPVISLSNVVREGPALVNHHDNPLALYIFTTNTKQAEEIIDTTRSGAVVVNDVLVHAGSAGIPFGGVGASGTGRYHGKYGFEEFSHARPILRQPNAIEFALTARYPPYTPGKAKRLRFLGVPGEWFPRTGPIRHSLLHKILSKWWLVLIVLAAYQIKAKF